MNILILVFLALFSSAFAGVTSSNECEQPVLIHLKDQLKLVKYSTKGDFYYENSAEALQAFFAIDEVIDEICEEKKCDRGFRKTVKEAYNCKIIDKIVYSHFKRLDRKLDYTPEGLKVNDNEKIRRKYRRLPPLDDYLKKVNSLNELRFKRVGYADIDQALEKKLNKTFYRKEQGIFRLTPRESMFYNYSRIQIGHLSTILMEHVKTMNAQSAFIEITEQDGTIKRIPIAREDMYRMSVRLLDVRLDDENRKGIIQGQGTNYGDLIMAAYITGELDKEVIEVIMALPEMDEHHASVLDRVKNVSIQLGKTALLMNPITAPYATVAFIIYESIQRKKAYEKNMANKTHLF